MDFFKDLISWEAAKATAFLVGVGGILAAIRIFYIAIKKEHRADMVTQHDIDSVDSAENEKQWRRVSLKQDRRITLLERRIDEQQDQINECIEERATLKEADRYKQSRIEQLNEADKNKQLRIEQLERRVEYCEKNHIDLTDSKVARIIKRHKEIEDRKKTRVVNPNEDTLNGDLQ